MHRHWQLGAFSKICLAFIVWLCFPCHLSIYCETEAVAAEGQTQKSPCTCCVGCSPALCKCLCRDAAEAAAAEGQLLNPPYVHHVAVAPTSDRPGVRLAAAARGNGTIAVYDIDSQVMHPPAATLVRAEAGGTALQQHDGPAQNTTTFSFELALSPQAADNHPIASHQMAKSLMGFRCCSRASL